MGHARHCETPVATGLRQVHSAQGGAGLRDRTLKGDGFVAQGTRHEVSGIILVAAAIVAYLALGGQSEGALGSVVAHGLKAGLGLTAWWIPGFVGVVGVFAILGRPAWATPSRMWAVLGLTLVLDGLTGLGGTAPGGFVGYGIGHGLRFLVGTAGAVVLLIAFFLALLVLVTGGSVREGARVSGRGLLWAANRTGTGGLRAVRALADWVFPVADREPLPAGPDTDGGPGSPGQEAAAPSRILPEETALTGHTPAEIEAPKPLPLRRTRGAGGVPASAAGFGAGGAGADLPPLSLLAEGEPASLRGREPEIRAELLLETLRHFGIEARLSEVTRGPAVTRFEVVPPPGVKVSRIVNLADDIALSLAASGVRMEAPIPGKSAIGIEVPNQAVSVVRLREVLEAPAFKSAASPLSVALGKDIAGKPVVAQLDQMPHLLVAGATGSGKSVLINVLIASLLFRSTPAQVQLLLIDPKVVELSGFNGIPHLVTPVVTDPKKASQALRWAVREMERRYQIFAQRGVRDIARYNAQLQEEDTFLPYTVVVIDELADLMMVAPVEVEESINRLAQMARAAGIHLVVATQRPSVDVITGTIKANIPSRIAFAVSSQVDSRTILDGSGAEKLLGRGDMLYSPVGAAKPQRLQGCYVTESEMEALVSYLRERAPDELPSLEFQGAEETEAPTDTDSLFQDALRVVVESRQASASMLQRRLRVGYTRAARIIDQMAERGYVGPQDGARPRDVYLSLDQYHRLFADGDTEAR